MKKRFFFVFELLMALLMISFAVLIELKGEVKNHGYFAMTIGVPGFIVFLHTLLYKPFSKKNWLFVLILFIIAIGCDIGILFIFKLLTLEIREYIVLVLIDVIVSLILLMFGAVYENAK